LSAAAAIGKFSYTSITLVSQRHGRLRATIGGVRLRLHGRLLLDKSVRRNACITTKIEVNQETPPNHSNLSFATPRPIASDDWWCSITTSRPFTARQIGARKGMYNDSIVSACFSCYVAVCSTSLVCAMRSVSKTLAQNLRLTPWAVESFLVVVLSAAAAIRKLPHAIQTLVSGDDWWCSITTSRPFTARQIGAHIERQQ